MYRTRSRCFSKGLSAAIGAIFIIACFPAYVPAQSLDDAVASQLATVDSRACDKLLGPVGNVGDLTGGLQSICGRTTSAGAGVQPSAASGGAAGTPTTLPSVVERRLEKDRGVETPDHDKGPEGPGAIWEFGRWSAFISGEYESLDRDKTMFEDGYDSVIRQATVGADVRLSAYSLLGLALVTSKQEGDFDGDGDFDVSSYGVILYGSYQPADETFIQISVRYFDRSNDRERAASFSSPDDSPSTYSGRPQADYDASEYGASILAGYDFVIDRVTLCPRVGLDWSTTNYDEYVEYGRSGLELTFYEEDVTSLQTSVGVQATSSISTPIGVVSPQASLAWKHEYQNDQRNPEVSFVGDTRGKRFTYQTDEPDRDFFELNAGLVLALPHGFQVFGNYRTLFGHSFYSNNAGTLGLRKEF